MTDSTRKLLVTWLNVAKFLATERTITAITRGFDFILFIMILRDPTPAGVLKTFLILTPAHIAMTILILGGINFFSLRGVDLTGLEELRQMAEKKYLPSQWFKRFIGWMLRRRITIFAIGSWFFLDPDYVTLLLRDRNRGFWTNLWRITVPSVILAMLVWTPICFAAVRGYKYAAWIWNSF